MVARAFRLFGPEDRPAVGSAEEAGEGGGAGRTLADIIGAIPAEPETADAAWQAIRSALNEIGAAFPEALVPVSPDDRLTLFRAQDNGNRSSGDVAALVQHHLGLPVEKLPAAVFVPALRALAAFPSRGPGKEEYLGRLPATPGKLKALELRDLLHSLIRDGVLTDEEIPRSGANGSVSQKDMASVVESLRERALAEAGKGAA
jgi:hypothetical protein